MLKKKIVWLVIAMLIISLIATGCNSTTTSGKGGKDTLTVAQGADPKSFDPHATNDQPSSRISKQIYSRLVEANEKMEIIPGLAESWNKIDDLTWEFNLRKGVKFHNGEEFKANDVKFTLERMKASQTVAHILGPVEEIKIADDYKVLIKTSEPFAPLLAHLSHTASSILNEKAVTEAGEDYGQHPIGTGPFKFIQWDAGDKVIIERFDEYFGGPAKLKTVVFRSIPEGTNRAIGLETGEIDIAYDIDPIDKEKVKTHNNLELIEGPSLSSQYIGFNINKEPFNNVKVRKALNHAINVQEIIDVVLEGAGQKANSPLADMVFGHNPDIKGYEYNVQKAKDLLKEAGYEKGFKTTIWTNENPVRVQIADIVQAQLKEVGIDVSIEVVEWSAYLDRTANGEHDMFILGWVAVTGDADYGLYALFHSSQHGSSGNRTFFSNPTVDKLLDEGKTTVDSNKRLKAYKEAQEIIVEEAPQLFLYFATQNAGVQKNIKGFTLHPAGHHSVYDVSFK
ncbi:peptide/nickel transport system substrate-binding protein [Proteiniborus ethanoligenes]|uniref:Peptide/nickel transport system substrate-binding protein n=1 Tax=Proteiniborus ethanoligenes TaxID=415015 RepID=A0A1H3Q5N6_9FIRM|nr:glutathione ABC transporter substrate-binding protein [Proteiniborus ethanoligenes]SDZ08686.1 peptide/nickel transport system substrate-binding protein [Proteiniborus ethanoligenes]